MRGFSTNPRGEPILNPAWLNMPKAKAPGWGINGPGVSAEWTQGGESEWNSAAASADEERATIFQDVEIPRPGSYRVWIRYADWARKTETFLVRITQGGKETFRHEFGKRDLVDPHDEISMYWGWSFTWDGVPANLQKGAARISIEIEGSADARRHVDCLVVTNDLAFVPSGRRKPDFAAMRYLREMTAAQVKLAPLIAEKDVESQSNYWQRPKLAGRDFLMPWNIAREFWPLYEKPPAERPLYPFHYESIDEFVKNYKGVSKIPIFSSKFVAPVIYINHLPELLKEGSPFIRYLRDTKSPFAVKINYGAATMSDADGQAAWKLLTGEFKDQFLGWISGESVGYVWDSAATELKTTPSMSRTELLEAHRQFYTNALDRKWSNTFHTPTGPMWDKLIPAQSTSSTSFAHALMEWGTRLLGMETAAVQPMTAMRIAFTRGAARQYGGTFLYYHAPNFGDTATTFTKQQNFAGPDNFFHSRYGATMGPSLSWYRKSYYHYYMSGASAIYLEQGFDQFFKPGPGEHPLQLNPLGRITDEFMRFAERHPDRGTPYTPVAVLLDPAHGWEMTDHPHWPFGVSQISRSDRALRELFGVAYYPGTVVEGEPAMADRQAFVAGVFGNIFDILVASNQTRTSSSSVSPIDAINAYKAVVVGGQPNWSAVWSRKLTEYIRGGGTLVINSTQIKGLTTDLLGVRVTDASAEADTARCVSANESNQNLEGQMFRYQKIELKGAVPLIVAPNGDALVTTNRVGKGTVVFSALPDLLGEDERITPFAAHTLAHVFSEASPVNVSGEVEYLINRTTRGWVVTLINNNGVFKPPQGMAQVDRNAIVPVTVALRGQKIQSAVDWVTDKPVTVTNDLVNLELSPGSIAIVELNAMNERVSRLCLKS
jgi:hypothetical protein